MATTQEINQLAGAAAEHGDLYQVALCQLAIAGAVDPDTYSALDNIDRSCLADHYGIGTDGTTQSAVSVGIAWRECERLIDLDASDI